MTSSVLVFPSEGSLHYSLSSQSLPLDSSYLIGAIGQIVAFDGIIVNNAAIPAATVGYSLTYVFVAIGVVLIALYAFKNS